MLHENWSNTSDFVNTPEIFGTVAIHSPALTDAMRLIDVQPCTCKHPHKCKCVCKLTADQKYICTKMNTRLPFLPVDGPAECKLFATMMLSTSSAVVDFEKMA